MVSSLIFQKLFSGRGSPSPVPRPLPPLFLGLRPRFGLRPQFSGASRPRLRLRPRYSGASRSRFGLRPQLSIGDLGLAPQNKFLDPPLAGLPILMKHCSSEMSTRSCRGKRHHQSDRRLLLWIHRLRLYAEFAAFSYMLALPNGP